MGTTTFSGPIKAGTIKNTTGTTVGSDIANVGTLVSIQSMATTQAAQASSPATTIVVPANSTILRLAVLVTVGGTSTTTGGFGWDNNDAAINIADPDALTGGTQVQTSTRGFIAVTNPGSNVGRIENWITTGTTDKRILFTPGATGDGEYVIVVEYAQAINAAANP